MGKTLRTYYAPDVAGQIVWLPDLDGTNAVPVPKGFYKLSTTAITTISNAKYTYPSLYAQFTSVNSASPIYRNGEHLVVQKIQGFPKRTKTIAMSFTSSSFTPYLNEFRFYNDGNNAGWRMSFHLAGTQGGGGNPGCTLANITLLNGTVCSVNCAQALSGNYTTATNATLDQYAGCRLYSNNGSGADFVAFWGEAMVNEPTSYLSASIMDTPAITPFLRLYSDLPV